MTYTTRMVKSSAGLTQEQALLSLQNHEQFVPGTRIAAIYNQGGCWVAKLMEPKTAFAGLPVVDELTGNNLGNAVSDATGNLADVTKNIGQNDLEGVQNLVQDYGQGIGDVAKGYAEGGLGGGLEAGLDATKELGGNLADTAGQNLDVIEKGIGNLFSSTHESADIPAFDDEAKDEPKEEKEEKEEGPEIEVEFEGFDKDEDHEEKHEKSEDKGIKELEKKVNLILDALGINEKGAEPKGPKPPAAPAPAPAPAAPAAPAGGPKKSEPLPPGSGAKLKPGEVPNKPGMTPVGAPTFSSAREATSVAPGMQSNPQSTDGTPTSSGPVKSTGCQVCGGNNPQCAQCGGSRVGSFVASQHDPNREVSIRMAKAQLENEFKGYKVARIKRDQDYIHALISR